MNLLTLNSRKFDGGCRGAAEGALRAPVERDRNGRNSAVAWPSTKKDSYEIFRGFPKTFSHQSLRKGESARNLTTTDTVQIETNDLPVQKNIQLIQIDPNFAAGQRGLFCKQYGVQRPHALRPVRTHNNLVLQYNHAPCESSYAFTVCGWPYACPYFVKRKRNGWRRSATLSS